VLLPLYAHVSRPFWTGQPLAYPAVQKSGAAADVKASLRRITKAFRRPIAEKSVGVPPYRRKMALPERSFLRSALEEMAPTIRSDVETALRQAVTE